MADDVRQFPSTLTTPTGCAYCGYDLILLSSDGVCPECSTPIVHTLHGAMSVPAPVIRGVRASLLLVALSLIAILSVTVLSAMGSPGVLAILAVLVSVLSLMFGVIIIAGIETSSVGQPWSRPPGPKDRMLRFVIGASLAVFVFSVLCMFLVPMSGSVNSLPGVLLVGVTAFDLMSALGLVRLHRVLRHIDPQATIYMLCIFVAGVASSVTTFAISAVIMVYFEPKPPPSAIQLVLAICAGLFFCSSLGCIVCSLIRSIWCSRLLQNRVGES